MSFLLFPFLNIINKKYQKGEYQRILRGYSILHSNKDKYSIYVNIHRVSSLILTGDAKWTAEYLYLEKEGQLDLLGDEDKKYIALYTFLISKGDMKKIYDIEKLDLSKVSKRTKKYFPWATEDMKLALKKYPDEERGVAEIEFV